MHRVNAALLGVCLVSPALLADEPEAPDLAFLEFLGEWQEEGEAWLDTQKLEEITVDSTSETEVDDE